MSHVFKTKNLSINNIGGQRYFPKGDDGSGKVIEREKAAVVFFIAHQQFAKAVKPAVHHVNNPAPRATSP